MSWTSWQLTADRVHCSEGWKNVYQIWNKVDKQQFLLSYVMNIMTTDRVHCSEGWKEVCQIWNKVGGEKISLSMMQNPSNTIFTLAMQLTITITFAMQCLALKKHGQQTAGSLESSLSCRNDWDQCLPYSLPPHLQDQWCQDCSKVAGMTLWTGLAEEGQDLEVVANHIQSLHSSILAPHHGHYFSSLVWVLVNKQKYQFNP